MVPCVESSVSSVPSCRHLAQTSRRGKNTSPQAGQRLPSSQRLLGRIVGNPEEAFLDGHSGHALLVSICLPSTNRPQSTRRSASSGSPGQRFWQNHLGSAGKQGVPRRHCAECAGTHEYRT